MRGTGSNKGAITLNALTDVTAHDDMTLNTGALVGVPVSDTKVTANATTGIFVGDNTSVTTQRGNIEMSSRILADVEAHAKTSVWGLAGIGATGKSETSLSATNDIDFAAGSLVRGNGAVSITTNNPLDRMDVVAKTDIYNNTLIAGIFGEKAKSTLNVDTSIIRIRENATIQSASDLTIKASDGTRNAKGKGFKQWLQYVGIAVVPLSGNFGGENEPQNNTVTDGEIETGVFNHQHIAFGRDFGSFIQDPDNSSAVTRRPLQKIGSQWVYTDNNTIASLSIDNLTGDLAKVSEAMTS